MRTQRGVRESAVSELVELGPEVAECMALEVPPSAATVECFVMTRAAQRAWAAINDQLGQPYGASFWIAGPAGAGKTHFLNYVIALNRRAGALSAEPQRQLTLALEISGRIRGADFDRSLLELLAHELAGGNDKAGAFWRQLRGAEALRVALDQARRQGVRSATAVVDFAQADTRPLAATIAALGDLAATLKQPKFTLIAAGRGAPPPGARAFEVAAAADETTAVAIGRARRLDDAAAKIIDHAYRAIDTNGAQPRAIFPFHPATIAVLRALAGPAGGVAALARLARTAIAPWREAGLWRRLVYPADLMQPGTLRRGVEARLGEAGRGALRLAYAAANGLDEDRRALARELVDTLMLDELAGAVPAPSLDDLMTRMPALVFGGRRRAQNGDDANAALRAVAAELAAHSRGVVVLEVPARGVRFNPRAAGTPEVAAFNAALALVRRFDATITAAEDLPELAAKLKRLEDAMASALEAVWRNRDLINAAVHEAGGRLAPDQDKTLADFVVLAEGGAPMLLEYGADTRGREVALQTIADYETLAALAAALPRLRSMRDYLLATGLSADLDGAVRERGHETLAAECQLLLVAVSPAALFSASRNFDSLEARFQKFKWTYVQYYRGAHDAWRLEMERLAGLAEDSRRHLDALRRLNSIGALGAPQGAELAAKMALLEALVVRCGLEGPLAPEVTARCPDCCFVAGTPSPREDLSDLLVRTQRTLQAKLAVLSQSAIAQLIQEHDHGHRLEGFLKITQAAHTQVLVRVLDDKLTRYLARLLDDNAGEAASSRPSPRGVVQTLRPKRIRRPGAAHSARALKSPSNGDGN